MAFRRGKIIKREFKKFKYGGYQEGNGNCSVSSTGRWNGVNKIGKCSENETLKMPIPPNSSNVINFLQLIGKLKVI